MTLAAALSRHPKFLTGVRKIILAGRSSYLSRPRWWRRFIFVAKTLKLENAVQKIMQLMCAFKFVTICCFVCVKLPQVFLVRYSSLSQQAGLPISSEVEAGESVQKHFCCSLAEIIIVSSSFFCMSDKKRRSSIGMGWKMVGLVFLFSLQVIICEYQSQFCRCKSLKLKVVRDDFQGYRVQPNDEFHSADCGIYDWETLN